MRHNERTFLTCAGAMVVSALLLVSLSAQEPAPKALPSKTADEPAESLFNGETLGDWTATRFGGEGEVVVENGAIVLPAGTDMTGVTWDGAPLPKVDYEVELEAMRVEGSDFFCGLTFPVKDEHCSLILGGWGGVTVGLSTIDRDDASQNETTQSIKFKQNRWYRVRVRVTESRIQAWLDGRRIVNVDTTGKKIDVRVEMLLCKPLGVATWQTRGALRNIKLRHLNEQEVAEVKKQ